MNNEEIIKKIAAYIELQEWDKTLLNYVNSIPVPNSRRFADIKDYVNAVIGHSTGELRKVKMQTIVAFPFAFIKPSEASSYWREADKNYQSWLTQILIKL